MRVFILPRILPAILAATLGCAGLCAQEKGKADRLTEEESKKLESLQLRYDLAHWEITQVQWAKPMEKLRKRYKESMQRVQKSFEEAGDLQRALAAREAAKVDPTVATINRKVPQVGSVQSGFLDLKKGIELRLKQALEELAKSHVAKLSAYKLELTKGGRLDSALVIDQVIKEFRAKGRATAGVRPRPPIAPKSSVQGAANWAQVGRDLDGKAAGDNSGQTVSLSANGRRLAIGAWKHDGKGSDSGCVSIYEWSGTRWLQLGKDIHGEAGGDYSGESLSLSADGRRVAIGAGGNDGNGFQSGHVRVYEWTGKNWVQMGKDLNGEFQGDHAGRDGVSLSADGQWLAIGAPTNDGNGKDSGQVRVYGWSGRAWAQVGRDLDGKAAGDESGQRVSLSANGRRLAIGAWKHDGKGSDSGCVSIYEWSGTRWLQLGKDIHGEAGGDYSGESLSLSADGRRVAIGAGGNDGNGFQSGHVRVYEWTGKNWVQMGKDLNGEFQGDHAGRDGVSLSADGQWLAIGAPTNDGNGKDSGQVRVYGWSGRAWVQVGRDLDGKAAGDQSGQAVSLSANGKLLAVGAHYNDGNGKNSGLARIFQVKLISEKP